MISTRKAAERGRTEIGWLDSRHTFSFGEYHDPRQMGFRVLRVINDDRVAPAAGFPTHGHADMEIVSYVLSGALEHKDSLGTGSVIRPGDLQRMSAGTGVRHSEFNASPDQPVHFLQIWILPERRALAPGYEQKSYPPAERRGRLRLVGSRDGRDGAVTIHQDVELHAGLFKAGEQITHAIAPGRSAWVQVAAGAIALDGQTLREGDGAAITSQSAFTLAGDQGGDGEGGAADGEVLVFDLP
jgi:redox-sensitive bicupin YhaK (pirin superfamily)